MREKIPETSGTRGVSRKSRAGLFVLSLLCALGMARCDGEHAVSVTAQEPAGAAVAAVAELGLSPSNPQVAQGTVQPFSLRGLFADGRSEDVTAQARFSVRDEAGRPIAPLPEGLPFARPGRYTVTAEYAGRSLSTPVTVTAATISSLSVSPRTPKVPRGLTQQFTATAKYSDGTTQDVTGMATWSAKDTVGVNVALVDSTGLVTAKEVGKAQVQARYMAKTSYTTMEVTPAARTSLVINPSNPSIAKGTSIAFAATAMYSDGSTADLTSQVTWGVADVEGTGIAAIASSGTAFGKEKGKARISAEIDGDVAETQLTVTAAAVASIAISPSSASVPKGTSQRFAAVATLTDGSTQDVSAVAAWSSTDLEGTGVASVDAMGQARANQVGKASIGCSYGGKSATALLQVTPAVLTNLVLLPDTVSLPLGLSTRLSAIAVYSDSTQQDVSILSTWSSSDVIGTGVISIGFPGVVQGRARGTARVTASFGTRTVSANVEVTAAIATALSITPASAVLARGATQQLKAMAQLSDGTSRDVSAAATWIAADVRGSGVASVDSKGLVSANADGLAEITAAFMTFSAKAQISVGAFTRIPTGVTGYLWGIYSSGPSDIWVVGDNGAVLHYDGTAWNRVSFTTEKLLSIWGAGANDIWVGGYGAKVFHYDGTSWSAVPVPGSGTLLGLTGTGSRDVWATNGSAVSHWNGTAWSNTSVTGTTQAVWAVSPSDVWAVGTSGSANHYDGTKWTSVPTPVTDTFWGVGGSGGKDVWAVGMNGAIARWDGTSFKKVAAGTTANLVSVAAISASDAWIAGWGATLLRWNGTTWIPVSTGVTSNLMAVLPTPTSLWVTGWEGTLLQRP